MSESVIYKMVNESALKKILQSEGGLYIRRVFKLMIADLKQSVCVEGLR